MSGDSWPGIVLVIAALALIVIATAAETGAVFVSRLRVKAFATKGLPRAAALESYVHERQALLGTIAVARNTAVVIGVAVGTYLVLRETGNTWAALAITAACAVVALALLEALPRLLVARSPERWGLRLVPVMSIFRVVFGLPAKALDMAANALLPARRSGEDDLSGEDSDELLRLVELHEGSRDAESGEISMLRRVAQMVDTSAREIMVPRIDMIAVDADASVEELLKVIVDRGLSRIPIYEETVDEIVGIVHAKDLLGRMANGKVNASLRELARPPYFVPDGKHIDDLLTDLRENKVHLAIVVDEYGGTAGLVTIEDVIEEIVGEIQDEYDREEAAIHRVSENEAIVDARIDLDDVNAMLSVHIPNEESDTIGGFIYHQLGRMPSSGDEVQADGVRLRVLTVVGRRIKKVRLTKVAPQQAESQAT
jgi:CBS domain containing-hemolysin-like protein